MDPDTDGALQKAYVSEVIMHYVLCIMFIQYFPGHMVLYAWQALNTNLNCV